MPAPDVPGRPPLAGVATGAGAMVCVGGSVAVSAVLLRAPVFTAEALRYAVACLILLAAARLTGRRLVWPRGTEWLWLLGVAATGLVLFNVALVDGSRYAQPAALGVAVACVPAMLAVIGPLAEGSRPRPAGVAAALVVTVRRRLGPGRRPHRRYRAGLGRGGVRLRVRVHPAGHPGPGPARPVGRVGPHHLDRSGLFAAIGLRTRARAPRPTWAPGTGWPLGTWPWR